MKLSDGEKLIILMLADLYEALDVEGEFDPGFIRRTITDNHLWGLRWKYTSLFEEEENPPDVKETANILDMWRFLEEGFKKLTKPDKARVQAETGNVKFI